MKNKKKNFPNTKACQTPSYQSKEVERIASWINAKNTKTMYIIFKLQKTKDTEKVLKKKKERKKHIIYGGMKVRIIFNFSLEIMQKNKNKNKPRQL